MNRVAKRWLIGICIGICIPAAFYSLRSYVHRNDKYARVAKIVGVDVGTWAELTRLLEKSSRTHSLTTRDIDREEDWLNHGNAEVRSRALSALFYCSDPSVKQRVIALIRTRLSDSKPALRMKAIGDLQESNDPTLAADVGRLAQDPVDYVRDAAKDALKSGTIERSIQ